MTNIHRTEGIKQTTVSRCEQRTQLSTQVFEYVPRIRSGTLSPPAAGVVSLQPCDKSEKGKRERQRDERSSANTNIPFGRVSPMPRARTGLTEQRK